MRVSAAILAEYRRLLDELGRQAADRVSASIAYTSGTRVAPVRDAAIEALSDAAAVEGDVAQALAAQLFDEVCEAEGIDAMPGELFEGVIDEAWIERKVHYFARSLIEGNRAKFEGDCRKLADFYVKRCAYENTVRNCDANHVRYARVPTGSETCPWCMMLASRGFVYHSKLTASHGMHQNCDCIIVPGRGGGHARDATQIEGYDPNEWYARWADTGFKGAGSGSSHAHAKRYEPTIDADESMRLQRKLLKGLSKADRERAMDIILDANDVWANERHDVDVHNHFADRVRRAMLDNHITNADLAERARRRDGTLDDPHDMIAVSLDFLTQDDELRRRVRLMEPEPGFEGYVDVAVHSDGTLFGYQHLGSESRDNTWDSMRITASDLAKAIRESPEWHGEPIRLASCSAGKYPDGAAQHLADALGVPVRAADMDVYVASDGWYTLADSDDDAGAIRMGLAESKGHWKTFHPKQGEQSDRP